MNKGNGCPLHCNMRKMLMAFPDLREMSMRTQGVTCSSSAEVTFMQPITRVVS